MKENNKLRNARERMGLFKQLLALIEEYINNPELLSTRNIEIIRKIYKKFTILIEVLNNQKRQNQ
jgi:hypothetical protein